MARLRPPSILFLAAVLVTGGLTLGFGIKALSAVGQAYRAEDLAYSETPQSFRAWFLTESREAPSGEALAQAVSQRFGVMRVDKRHAVVHAMMSDRYMESLWTDDKDRRQALEGLLKGVLGALSSAPLEGELWLAAARLRRRSSGFDEIPESYLQASYRYTPREIYLVVDRLLYASQVATILSPQTRELARRDQEYLARFPDQALATRIEDRLRSTDFSAE